MPSTPTHGLRWPLATDTPDVPRDLQNLAEDTDSAITGYLEVHSRGNAPAQSVPNGSDVRLTVTPTASAGIVENTDVFTLPEAGYYLVALRVATASGYTGTRLYVSVQESNGNDHRASFGYGENEASVSALVHSTGSNTVQYRAYQATGGSITMGGSYSIKYLGA